MTVADTLDIFARCDWQPSDVIEARGVHRNGEARKLFWCAAADLAAHADELTALNRGGRNLYAGINPRKCAGASGDAGVAIARALFADFDHCTIEQADAKRIAAGMPTPTLAVFSGHGTHFYWRLLKAIDPAAWREWQKDLAALLGSDPQVVNPERVARLPGFLNLKSEPYVRSEIIDCDPSRVYDLADLPIPMRAGSDTPAPVFTIRRHVEPGSEGDRVERCRAYLRKCPPGISGAGGHDRTFAAANICNRFGLSEAEALDVLREFNLRCDPPWTPRELEHKVKSAYSKNTCERGAKLRDDRQRSSVFTVTRRRGAA